MPRVYSECIRYRATTRFEIYKGGVKLQSVFPVFENILQVLEAEGQLSSCRSFADNVLMALDKAEDFGSGKIHCPQCSSRKLKSGEEYYFQAVVTPVMVCPKRPQVILLVPELIVPPDGHEQQDCENAAAKRWLLQHGQRYHSLKLTVLGDEFYCHQLWCKLLLSGQFNFILVCLPESHKTRYEHLEGIPLPAVIRQRWTGKAEETYTYCDLNQLLLRDGDDALLVKECELVVTRPDGKVIYKHGFATNHLIITQSVEDLVLALRTRWQVENENNNLLKTKGYNLEHSFGLVLQHLPSLASLNILSLLFHLLQELLDQKYRLVRAHLSTRKTFSDDLQALTRYLCFDSWDHLLTFMLQGLELDLPPNTS